MSETDKPEPQQEEPYIVVHLRCNPRDLAELETLIGWIKRDPVVGRLKAQIGREKALRYAVGVALAHPPAYVTEGNG